MTKKAIRLLVVALAVFLPVVLYCWDVIPSDSLTVTRMLVTKRRVIRFAWANGRLPATLAELPRMVGYDSEIKDGWGRPLAFSVTPIGTVRLVSLGADGRQGGMGDNRDLEGIFESRTSEGAWCSELVGWVEGPSQLK